MTNLPRASESNPADHHVVATTVATLTDERRPERTLLFLIKL